MRHYYFIFPVQMKHKLKFTVQHGKKEEEGKVEEKRETEAMEEQSDGYCRTSQQGTDRRLTQRLTELCSCR